MILSDKTIMSLRQEGTLSISPLQDNQIQPASVDFSGEITPELFNANRCASELQGRPQNKATGICPDGSAARRPYCGKYQGQRGGTGSKVYLDEESYDIWQEEKQPFVSQTDREEG